MSADDSILLVEDDPAAVCIALHAFAKSGVDKERIIVAEDGQAALNHLLAKKKDDRGTPCLILLDLKLPRIDGLEVLKRLRETDRLKEVPVIILTNSDEERDIARSYSLGANSYLRKPIDFTQLIELLEQLGLISK